MIQAMPLIGGGHDIAQYNASGQRVRGICEAYDPFWCDVLLEVLEAWEVAQFAEPDYEALANEPEHQYERVEAAIQ